MQNYTLDQKTRISHAMHLSSKALQLHLSGDKINSNLLWSQAKEALASVIIEHRGMI